MLACLEVCTDLGDALIRKLVPDQRDAGYECEDRGQHVDHEVDAHLGGSSLLDIGNITNCLKKQDNRCADRGCQLNAEAQHGSCKTFLTLSKLPVAVLEGVPRDPMKDAPIRYTGLFVGLRNRATKPAAMTTFMMIM